MSFFGPRPEPSELPPDPALGWRPPIWDRPSEHLLGSPVAIGGLLAITPDRALALTDVVAYPNGFSFDLEIRANPMVPRSPEHRHGGPMFMHGGSSGPRLGIEFADGSRAGGDDPSPAPFGGSMMLLRAAAVEPATPDGPLLMMRGGGGSGSSFEIGFWCWPLPPAGPMRVFVEWSDQGIPETSREFDATTIRVAASNATELWAPPE